MAEEEITNGELRRTMLAMREEMREGFATVNRRLDNRVSKELYTTERDALVARVAGVERTMEQDENKVTATRRWMIGLFVAVMIALLPYTGAVPVGTNQGR